MQVWDGSSRRELPLSACGCCAMGLSKKPHQKLGATFSIPQWDDRNTFEHDRRILRAEMNVTRQPMNHCGQSMVAIDIIITAVDLSSPACVTATISPWHLEDDGTKKPKSLSGS